MRSSVSYQQYKHDTHLFDFVHFAIVTCACRTSRARTHRCCYDVSYNLGIPSTIHFSVQLQSSELTLRIEIFLRCKEAFIAMPHGDGHCLVLNLYRCSSWTKIAFLQIPWNCAFLFWHTLCSRDTAGMMRHHVKVGTTDEEKKKEAMAWLHASCNLPHLSSAASVHASNEICISLLPEGLALGTHAKRTSLHCYDTGYVWSLS